MQTERYRVDYAPLGQGEDDEDFDAGCCHYEGVHFVTLEEAKAACPKYAAKCLFNSASVYREFLETDDGLPHYWLTDDEPVYCE